MKKYVIMSLMSISLLMTACAGKEKSEPAEPVKEVEAVEEIEEVEAIQEVVEEANDEALDVNALYDSFMEGTVADSNGKNCCYAKNDPYYEDYFDLEWAVYDLNGDGINELIPRLYGSYTSEFYSCIDGKIITVNNEVFGSEGGFVNTKNQLVATDCSHANRNQYLVSEYSGAEKVNIVLFFAKWWDDAGNPDNTEYFKYEGEGFWDASYEDYTIITEKEYEELVQEYAQKNEVITFTGVDNSANSANPWTTSDKQGVLDATGFDMSAPEGATDVLYSYMAEEGMAQLTYVYEGADWTYRIQSAEALTDISGMYYEWISETSGKVSGLEAEYKGYSEQAEESEFIDDMFYVQLVNWYDDSTKATYSLSAAGKNIDGMDIQWYAESLIAK